MPERVFSGERLKVRWPLLIVLPLQLLIVVATTLWWSVQYGREELFSNTQHDATKNLRWTTARLVRTITRELKHNDIDAVRGDIIGFGTNPDMVSVLLTDESGRIIASKRLTDVDSDADDSKFPARLLSISGFRDARENAFDSRAGRIEYFPEARMLTAFWAGIPRPSPSGDPAARSATLIVVQDVSPLILRSLATLYYQAFVILLVSSVCTLLVGVFFHLRVRKRLERIAAVTTLVGKGATNVASGIAGNDEVAALAESFDRMIAEKSAVEQKLLDSESRFRAMFEQAALGVAQIDVKTRSFLEVNQCFCDLVGYGREELLHLKTTDIISPANLEAGHDDMKRLVSGDICEFTMETSYFRKNGIVIWGRVTVSAMWLPDNSITSYIAIVEDITQDVLSRKRLAESEQRHRKLVEHSPFCIHEIAMDGTFTAMNPAGLAMLGLSEETEICGITYLSVVHQPDRPGVQTYLNLAFEGNTSHFEFSTEGGFEFQSCFVPMTDNTGTVCAVMGITQDVTERNRTFQILRDSEHQFRSIFEQAAVGVAQQGYHRGTILKVNQRYCDILGCREEDLVGRTWMDVTHPDDLHVGVDDHARLMSGDIREFSTEKRMQRPDGSTVWIHLTVSAMWQPGEHPTTNIAIAEDITDRVASRQQLRLSEERYRSLVNSSAATVWTTGPDGAFLTPQTMWEDYTGQPWEGHQGWGWGKMLHPDDAMEIQSAWRNGVKGTSPFFAEGRIFHAASGEYRYFEARAAALLNADSSVREWIGSIVDVHDRKDVEHALRTQHVRTEKMLSAMLDGYVLVDGKTRLTAVNDAYCKMVGYRPEELCRMTVAELDAMATPDTIATYLKEIQKSGRMQFETRHRHKDGRLISLDVSVSIMPNEDAENPHMAVFLRDISDRKAAERAVRQSQYELREMNASLETRVQERTQELRRANEDLEAYASSVAHDLRAPLRAMFGFAGALRDDYADRLDDEGREYTMYIESAARQMDDLIKDLLEYSRVGRSEMSIDPVDLNTVITQSMQQLDTEIKEHDAVIKLQRELGTVVGHRSTLVQVASNLISNAIKFVAAGTQPEIEISSEIRGEQLRLWVEDNGIGIHPDFQGKIFRVFERLHGIETYPGTGIGLAIVRRAVESMSGRFGVESEAGCGSRFWVEFRVARAK